MRWFIFALLMPIAIFAAPKYLTLTITPSYPLNVINTQLICSSLHANLESDALMSLEALKDIPFICKFVDDGKGNKQLKITLTLADPEA